MTALLIYILKVILCSGILFLYYHLFLRNRIFHQWNRFYLLAAVMISLLVPLLRLSMFQQDAVQQSALQYILVGQSADNYLEEFIVVSRQGMSTETWLTIVYVLVSLFFFFSICYSIFQVLALIRTHTVNKVDNIKFISTNVKGAPFSFMDYIFWNPEISLQSPTGQQIFQHEMVHIQEKHTWDKLFLQVVKVFFWSNPVFWLIHKELSNIHEFIADKKAVGESGTEGFAAMILQSAYPQQFQTITNSFFQNPIKRRLLMLTKRNNPRLSYAGRIIALTLVAFIAFAFTVRSTEAVKNSSQFSFVLSNPETPVVENQLPILDTVPKSNKQINSIDVHKKGDKTINELTITYTDGSSEKLTEKEAMQRGLIQNNAIKSQNNESNAGVVFRSGGPSSKDTTLQPLYILDGKEITKNEMNQIKPNDIQSVNVLKGESASSKYGDKGKNGVVEIITKEKGAADEMKIKAKGDRVHLNAGDASFEANEITVVGYRKEKAEGNDVVFEKTEFSASINPDDWREFLNKATKPILDDLNKKGVPGGKYTVQVRFVVEKDGSLSGMSIVKEPGFGLGDKVLEIMKQAPKWKPAIQNQRVVRSYHTQPITFLVEGKNANT